MRARASVAAFLSALAFSIPASADPPATANSLAIGLGFRYGVDLEDSVVNPWGTGLGVGVGYTLPSAVYLGANFDYFFGETETLPTGDASANIWQAMAEGGYDIGLGQSLVLRPKAGVGFASLNGEACVDTLGCDSRSESNLALAPGLTFLVVTQNFILSLDTRYDLVFAEETASALLFSLGIGF